MKSSQVTLIIIGFILLTLMVLNPTLEDHKESVKKMFLKEMEENGERKKLENVNELVASIGSAFADKFIDQMVSRNNYYLFSTTKYSIKDESKIIGFGIFGQVFLQDYDEIKTTFGETTINSDSKSNSYFNDRIAYQLSLIPESKIVDVYPWIQPDAIGEDFNAFINEFKKNIANYKIETDTVYVDNKQKINTTYSKESGFQKFVVSFYSDNSLRGAWFYLNEDPNVIIQFYKLNGFKIFEQEENGVFLSSLKYNYCLYVMTSDKGKSSISFITRRCDEIEGFQPNWFEKLIKIITN
jgi:hypothetical protein